MKMGSTVAHSPQCNGIAERELGSIEAAAAVERNRATVCSASEEQEAVGLGDVSGECTAKLKARLDISNGQQITERAAVRSGCAGHAMPMSLGNIL